MPSNVDFKTLIPAHLTDNSQLLVDYLDGVGELLNADIDYISGLGELVNPNTVPIAFIQKLADLLNTRIIGADTQTEARLRKQLIQAIDNLKIKGTYQSLINIAYLFGLHAQIKDMYTSDYITFVVEDWFVGNAGDNPSGLGSAYYKSPHFGVRFLLDTPKINPNPPSSWLSTYLWAASDAEDFISMVETVRPITTVPHYFLQMDGACNESGYYQTEPGDIKTCVTYNWVYSTVLFDDAKLFDDGNTFDSSIDAFLSSITTWKLGNGNVGIAPAIMWDDLSSITNTGTTVSYSQTNDYYQFDFDVPLLTACSDITELGLYTSGGVLVIASTFPYVTKDTTTIWHVTIKIHKGTGSVTKTEILLSIGGLTFFKDMITEV